MAAVMATQGQIDDIRKLVDDQMDPTDIANHFSRLADLNEIGRLKVRGIAADLYEGKEVTPDGRSLTEDSSD